MLTADTILALADDNPEGLFSGDKDTLRQEHIDLMKIWHPDASKDPQADKVSQKISVLYQEAERRLGSGKWVSGNEITLRGKDGKTYKIRYKRRIPFELGEFTYGDTNASYFIKPEFDNLLSNACSRINGLKYASIRMQESVSRYMPKIKSCFAAEDNTKVLVLEKTPEVFLLRDVLNASGGSLDPKHVAWIISALHNLACFFKYNGFSHNALSLDNCFISPKYHTILPLGGWWYGSLAGGPLTHLPKRTHQLAPPSIIRTKQSDLSLDLILIRALGRELLGDPTGMSLSATSTPKAMVNFLRGPTSGDALADYNYWQNTVLPESFGERKFTVMEVDSSKIYGS